MELNCKNIIKVNSGKSDGSTKTLKLEPIWAVQKLSAVIEENELEIFSSSLEEEKLEIDESKNNSNLKKCNQIEQKNEEGELK